MCAASKCTSNTCIHQHAYIEHFSVCVFWACSLRLFGNCWSAIMCSFLCFCCICLWSRTQIPNKHRAHGLFSRTKNPNQPPLIFCCPEQKSKISTHKSYKHQLCSSCMCVEMHITCTCAYMPLGYRWLPFDGWQSCKAILFFGGMTLLTDSWLLVTYRPIADPLGRRIKKLCLRVCRSQSEINTHQLPS